MTPHNHGDQKLAEDRFAREQLPTYEALLEENARMKAQIEGIGRKLPSIPATLSALDVIRREERQLCTLAAEGEAVSPEATDPTDIAYNIAVSHCAAAIRNME